MTSESQPAAMPGRPLPAGRRPGLLKRKRVLIVGLIVAGAMGYLGYTAFMGAATYYLTVGELLAREATVSGEDVRVMGKVVDGTVEKTPETNTIVFTVADKDGASVPVAYSGVVPDAFKPGADVVMEGTLNGKGTFEATNLLVKCPSKYEAAASQAPGEGTD